MSMSNNIKQGVKKRKEDYSSEQELRDLLNSATSKSLKLFIQRMEAGEVPIDNISDFIRVIGAYKEINGISEVMDGQGNTGALPEINMRQDKALQDRVQDGTINADEEGRMDVMNMSVDDMADLIRHMDAAQNAENEGAF
ncbi:hypothetical protein Thu_52 [Bacillus phage Thurquoise]|uniref:Uncharacterized protein n=1 Tax=Bacillus phage Deep Blue TaxID=1792245 RepID=A0A140HM28_9CAUD|nr:terminase small subunit [Bacillus phage Deep Blue]AMO26040.1 hypothetical protein Blue_218 [Bacillus phage Deep Blue]UXQ88912.1 hypothetical protein Thu_52 [Bacillus phage Thurquoise]